jgi:hypothetical protein
MAKFNYKNYMIEHAFTMIDEFKADLLKCNNVDEEIIVREVIKQYQNFLNNFTVGSDTRIFKI